MKGTLYCILAFVGLNNLTESTLTVLNLYQPQLIMKPMTNLLIIGTSKKIVEIFYLIITFFSSFVHPAIVPLNLI